MIINYRPILLGLATTLMSSLHSRAADQSLDPHLEPLRPLLDKIWKGEFKNAKPEQPVVDIAQWQRALNGQAVRILHSINDGVYGGESIVRWDEPKQQVTYYYFTTAGFMTIGVLKSQGGKLITHETVTGSAEGITEVRGTSEIRSDGTLQVKTEYLKNGTWVPGREVTYYETPTAKVVFR
ncbi:MAG: hypothetical protein U1G07_25300 [Verrucomicrobiota bacterium]